MIEVDPTTVAVNNPLVSIGSPRLVPVNLDFSRPDAADGAFEIDGSYIADRGEFKELKSIFWDNWDNPNDLRVEIMNSSQVIHLPAHSCGCAPVVCKGVSNVRVYGVPGAFVCNIGLYNNPSAAYTNVKPGAVSSGGGSGGGSTGGGTEATALYTRDTEARQSLVTITARLTDVLSDTAQIEAQLNRLGFNAGDLTTYDARVAGIAQQIANLLNNGISVGDATVRANTQAIASALAGTLNVSDATAEQALQSILAALQSQGADVADLRAKIDQLTFSNGQLLVTGATGGGGGTAPGDGSTINANIIGPLDGNGRLKTVDTDAGATLAQILTQVQKLAGLNYNQDGGLNVHVLNQTSGGGGGGSGGAITGPLNADGSVAVGDVPMRNGMATMLANFFNFVSFDSISPGYALRVVARHWQRIVPDGSGYRALTDRPITKNTKNAMPNNADPSGQGAKSFMEPLGAFSFVQDIDNTITRVVDANCPLGGYYFLDLERLGPNKEPNWFSPTYWEFLRRVGLVFDDCVHGALPNGQTKFRASLIFVKKAAYDVPPPQYWELAAMQYAAFSDAGSPKNTLGMGDLLFTTPDANLGPVERQGMTYNGFFAIATNAPIVSGRIRLNVQHYLMHGATSIET